MSENKDYLKTQIATYIGNKRSLLPIIEKEIKIIKDKEDRLLNCVDLFSGSGIVARLLKQYSNNLYVNDLELYSKIINDCYLSNKSDFNEELYYKYYSQIEDALLNKLEAGLITENYAPKDDSNIKDGERVFYTTKNALIIDTIRKEIDNIPIDYQKYFLGPLLVKSSIHTNTGGIFKGFYKDSNTGIGKYGGTAENALKRIKGNISIDKPILSNYECNVNIYQKDANDLVKELPKDIDIIYIDPPYNQHPYGSNYFMLNVIANNKIESPISKVSGIPNNWNRSNYNKKKEIYNTFNNLIKNITSKYIIVSYNSEGFLTLEDITKILSNYGNVDVKKIDYNTFRASRNLNNRDIHVKEYIFILERGKYNGQF